MCAMTMTRGEHFWCKRFHKLGKSRTNPQFFGRKSGFPTSNEIFSPTISGVNLMIHWATNFQLPFFPFEPSHRIEKSRIWSWRLPRPYPIFMEIYPNATFCLKHGHDVWGECCFLFYPTADDIWGGGPPEPRPPGHNGPNCHERLPSN